MLATPQPRSIQVSLFPKELAASQIVIVTTLKCSMVWRRLSANGRIQARSGRHDGSMQWKVAMERRGLNVNMGKTKMMVSVGSYVDPVQLSRYLCADCGKGVGVNSMLCIQCRKWCHKKCSELRILNVGHSFICPRCTNKPGHTGELPLHLDGVRVGIVNIFCYLWDVLSGEGSVERDIKLRTAIAWRKWRDNSGLLSNNSVPLSNRGGVYSSCVRFVLL